MRTMNVLISGASVGGPALAYWLRRYGFGVTVVERAAGLRPGGQAIDVRGPALGVVERMGVLDRIRARCTDLRGMSVVDDDGVELFRTTERTMSGGEIDSPDVEILRDDLAEILFEASRGEGVEYLFGDSVAELEQNADGVRVRFQSGARRTYDLVVGADGVHSGTRRMVFGTDEECYRHLGSYLGVWTVPNHLGLDRWQVVYRMRGSVWGGMAMSVRDNKEVRVYVGIDADVPPAEFLPRSVEEQKRLVVRAHADGRWEMPRLLEGVWDAPDFHFDSVSQIHLDSWSRGRVVLLGDAGYCGSPASGQGTTMALIGAYVLAGELAAAGGDHRAAFLGYERALREYVTASQEIAHIGVARLRTELEADLGDPEAAAQLAEDPADAFKKIGSIRFRDYATPAGLL
ncbi:FAD-dependent monooxygenase [Streptomyces sp. LX-29]|uniref:FAD-dependent monooxygenase n=1 Tax=Streptomyces sp. LX-29 TaxID=2900152 RepID=UPI00240D9552|nr:FAD-dependent monooxygenase [Streptomyces sp. LX-29]WFB09388.1 FAD-dependent monooxygenase [Streptomyces sp. LX-29]